MIDSHRSSQAKPAVARAASRQFPRQRSVISRADTSRISKALSIVFVAVFLLTSAAAFASRHLPGAANPDIPEFALELHSHGRLFYTLGNFSGMFEFLTRFEGADRAFGYHSVTLGGYYRLHPNLKAGAFYRIEFDALHDNDWIDDGATWLWADKSDRSEHVAMVDLSPRFLLSFLPGENWVFAMKNRYEYNITRSEHSLLLRPGLTYFWIREREPLMNFSLQYATYLSLNFGAVPWYRHGPYLNVLYHVTKNIQIDVGASRQWIYWSESEQYLTAFETSTYDENIYSPWIVDVGVILQL